MEETKKVKAPSKKAESTKAREKSVKTAPLSHGVGRRKSSVARVDLRRGSGKITVNDKNYELYFDTDVARISAHKPFVVLSSALHYDAYANVNGGGLNSQADAIKLGIARALLKLNEADRAALRAAGLLTVDSRIKERKKPGQKAARRKFQFVKR